MFVVFFFCKQKTAYEMRISDWSSDVCSSDLSLTANGLVFMKIGALNYLITNPRDMPGFVKELSKVPFTAITGVNTLFNGLLNTPGFEKIDFSHLRLTL